MILFLRESSYNWHYKKKERKEERLLGKKSSFFSTGVGERVGCWLGEARSHLANGRNSSGPQMIPELRDGI